MAWWFLVPVLVLILLLVWPIVWAQLRGAEFSFDRLWRGVLSLRRSSRGDDDRRTVGQTARAAMLERSRRRYNVYR